jgi:DnaJ-domain-containing protein 1
MDAGSMDRLFDRLGDLVRSFLGTSSAARPSRDPYQSLDPDEREAWEELDAYLRDEELSGRSRKPEWDARAAARQHLRTDYANLEVGFAAPFEEVQKAYRKLLVRYHPDRNASDPEKLRIATEITQRINASFQRIRDFEREQGGS